MARNWAITVGINRYHYLQPLKYGMSDADAVRQFFSQELRFYQVYHFTDQSLPIPQDYGPDLDSQPTSTTLGRFLRKRFEHPFLETGDNLWFFFAGHGIRHENRDYLMPIDGDRDDLTRSAIPLHYVSERLRRSGADNVIMLIDACRNGEGRRSGYSFGEENQQGVITLYSCSPEEASYEIDEIGGGAFTRILLESLRLQGEGNCATVERLYQRLRDRVPQLTRSYRRSAQMPYGRIEPPSKNHLILLPQQATLTDVVALKNDALRAEVERNFKNARHLWIRVLIVSPGDTDAIAGIERLSRGKSASQPSASEASAKSRSVVPPQQLVRLLSGFESPISRRKAFQLLGLIGGGVGSTAIGTAAFQFADKWASKRISSSIDRPSTDPSLIASDFTSVEFETIKVSATGAISSQETLQGSVFKEIIGDAILELMPISGGTFQMGSREGQGNDDERPQHQVSVPSFLMGRYEVTQAQWKAVSALPKVERDLEAAPSRFEGVSLPVEQISWDDAVEFCRRLTEYSGREYRLPSEAEWEYACRAETTTPFYFGETVTSEIVNYNANYSYGDGPQGEYRKQTTEVGSFPANSFGLCDMHGNVYEWCQDHWHASYVDAPSDGSTWITDGDISQKLLRGGCWYLDPVDCRSADRDRNTRGSWVNYVGFRVVCSASWTLA